MFHFTITTLALILSPLFTNVQGIQLPRPKGAFDIGTTSFEITDHSRLDHFAPTPQNRSVQLSLYYPIANSSSLPFSIYIPPLTAKDLETQFGAPAGTLSNISTYAHLDAPILNGGLKAPVVLFSPGFGITRLLYTTSAQELASEGYVVVAIDHPYDASIVEFSDGRIITAANFSDNDIYAALAVRAADARFVLDEFATGHNFKVPGLDKGFDTTHVGFFGHSLGGSAAATAMALDHRFVAGVNMDGSFQGPHVMRGFTKPFLLMASEGNNRTLDLSWAAVWPKMRGFKLEIGLKGARHLTFSDGPIITGLLGVKLENVFGTIAGERVEEIQHAYMTEFFDFALRGKKKKLLDGPSTKFPEVLFD